jgi:transcriptional regulator with XRE-family HTH domain
VHESLADRLIGLREGRGWSQEDLAQAAGVGLRTIQRAEQQVAKPRSGTLRAIAAAFNVDVSKLLRGHASERLIELATEFTCPTCSSTLSVRTYGSDEEGEIEIFECGFTRGNQNRLCPKDPAFPTFGDYELVYDEEPTGGLIWCYGFGRTRAAQGVHLKAGFGRTREEATRRLERSLVDARDGYAAAEAFMPEV